MNAYSDIQLLIRNGYAADEMVMLVFVDEQSVFIRLSIGMWRYWEISGILHIIFFNENTNGHRVWFLVARSGSGGGSGRWERGSTGL